MRAWPCPRADTPTVVYELSQHSLRVSDCDESVVWQSRLSPQRHRVGDFVWGDQSAVHPSSDGMQRLYDCILYRQVGHTRVVAYASIASYIFTRLIQRQKWSNDAYPPARGTGHGVRDLHRLCRSE